QVQETCMKECVQTICKPVTEQVVEKHCHCVEKMVCEQQVKEVCETVCQQVQETQYRECKRVVCRPVTETCMKTVCCTEYRNVTETCMKEVKREVCKQVTTIKTVQKKVPETVCEEYCVGGHLCLQHVPKYECSFDPCTCQNVQKQCGTRLALVRTP